MDKDTENVNEQQLNDGSAQLLGEGEKRPTVLPLENTKINGDTDCASEKLVPEDGKMNSSADASEVKFKSTDSQNGDAKIDIENIKLVFVGMTKDELMKFANDPYWIRLRWFLFVVFWLLWAGMLAGAIAIVVMAPKCAPPAPLKWWEQGPLYEVDVRYFKDGGDQQDGIGDIKGLISKLDYIKSLKATGIVVSLDFDDTTLDSFETLNDDFGSLEDFQSLAKSAQERGIEIILNLVINHSSKKHPWFIKSENNDEIYKDYYIWRSGASKNDSGIEIAPNNWRSVYGGSAWEWNDKRQKFYLHQFSKDQPDLNFTNPAVIEEFKKILTFWINQGVKGFQLEKAEYLLEDEDFRDESVGNKASDANLEDYHFYHHEMKTMFVPGVVEVLSNLKDVIINKTEGDGVLLVKGNSTRLYEYFQNTSHPVVDLVQVTRTFSEIGRNLSAPYLSAAVNNALRSSDRARIAWQVTSPGRVGSINPDAVDGLNMVTMLLPGTPLTHFGEELGLAGQWNSVMAWTNETNGGFSTSKLNSQQETLDFDTSNVESQKCKPESHFSIYQQLVDIRQEASIKYGRHNLSVVNGTVFVLSRVKSGVPGILVAFNPSDKNVTVDLRAFEDIDDKLTVLLQSSNLPPNSFKVRSKVDASSVSLPTRSSVVFSFVPKTTS